MIVALTFYSRAPAQPFIGEKSEDERDVLCARYLKAALIGLTIATAGIHAAAAQELLRAAAIVNDEVISVMDLELRMRLAVLATGLEDSQDVRQKLGSQVMRGLIDERLQAQEAERLDIEIKDEEIDGAIEQIASQNKMSRDAFLNLLAKRGIPKEAIAQQLRGQMVWQALMARRLRPSVRVTDDEVDAFVARLEADEGAVMRRVSEIFLSTDGSARDEETQANAQRLYEELRDGANFGALAQQFSESATAPRGGDLGWVQEGQLSEELETALESMKPGSLAPPIRSISGYHIIALRDQKRRTIGAVTVDLKQVVLPIPKNANQSVKTAVLRRLLGARDKLNGCENVAEVAKAVSSPAPVDAGKVPLNSLPAGLRSTISELEIGQPSEPLPLPGGAGIVLVCERSEDSVDRNRIKEQLAEEQLNTLSRRYMRDLRRSANVDVRI